MAAVVTGVSLSEYLRTSYHPDVEYIDGELKEKPVPEYFHGVLQIILGSWFRSHRSEWGIGASVETRIQVEQRRVRLPDVVVVRKEDEQRGGALMKAPLIAIEVLSPDDSYADLCGRAADLRAMGTENVWLFNPERRTAEIWTDENWRKVEGNRLQAVDAPVFVDLDRLWAELDN